MIKFKGINAWKNEFAEVRGTDEKEETDEYEQKRSVRRG